MGKNLNFVFWGTPEVARETLEILKASGYLPSLIITAPDAPAGRGMKMQESPATIFAKENNIPCLKPEKLDSDFTLKLSAFNFQLSVVIAYGKIIPENILNIPKLGSINVHYSLLPKYRGASPVESAILNGDNETGVSIQKMVYKMDTGPVIISEKVEIGRDEKARELRERLIIIGAELLIKVLNQKEWHETAQNESQATYCKKIQKEDGLLDLNDDPIKNYNKFRAYAHWPRTFFFQNNKRVIITEAILKGGQFIIKKVIPEGSKEITWEEFKK